MRYENLKTAFRQYNFLHNKYFRKIHPDSEKKATKVWDWNKEPVSGGIS